jgi:hypothetical protein
MAEEIIIEIDDEGKLEVKTKGFKGKGCLDASKWIEEHLGRRESIKKTADYYTEETREKVRLNRGNGN